MARCGYEVLRRGLEAPLLPYEVTGAVSPEAQSRRFNEWADRHSRADLIPATPDQIAMAQLKMPVPTQ